MRTKDRADGYMALAEQQDLTQGSLFKYLVKLSIPVMMGLAMYNLYSLTDLYWVKGLGPGAVAAVTICNLLFFFVFSIAQTFGMGTQALVSRYYGQKQPRDAVNTTRNAVFICTLTGIVLSASIFFSATFVSKLLGAKEDDVVALSEAYLRPYSLGFLFQLIAFTVNFAIRGTGDMMRPMMIMVVSTLFNVILDPLLIYGWGPFPEMGVAGAGVATTLAQFLAAVFALFLLVSGKTHLHVPVVIKFKPDWKEIGNMLRIGIPLGLQFFILSLSFVILQRLVAEYGKIAFAAIGTSFRIMHTASIPVIGIGSVVATLVGQNLGAKNPRRAHRATMLGITMSVTLCGAMAASYFFFSDSLMSFFSNSPDVIEVGRTVLRILAFSQLFLAVSIVLQHSFSGSGYTFPNMFSAIVRAIVTIILALILPRITGLGPIAIILCLPISTFTGMVVFIVFYKMGRWKTHMDRVEESRIAVMPPAGR